MARKRSRLILLTAKIRLVVCIFFLFSALIASCERNTMNAEYKRIKTSGLTGDALRIALTEFELKNVTHFSSKVDLGGFYLISGNIQRASDFFRRAKAVIPKSPNRETRTDIAILYGSLAQISLLQGEYAKAMDYVKKAIAVDSEKSKLYGFIKARILNAQGKQEQSLALFDELYQNQQYLMGDDDIRTYMYLLARANRFTDASVIVDLYFERGPFFHGLGLFASGVYENAGQPKKAILAAFLDFEYYSGYFETNYRHFLENIDNLERQLYLTGVLAEAEPVLYLLRSLYDDSGVIIDRRHTNFFVEEYCILKRKIQTNTLTPAEFEQFLQLERYFTQFPVFYWYVWQAALNLFPTSLARFTPALQRIILLNQHGRYAQPAWRELTRFMGYTE